MDKSYDVCVIGAGVTGSAVARELTKYDLSVCVLEKEEDVCSGTSKANSGIAHAGFDPVPGSRMAELNVRGAELIRSLHKELDFPYRQNGALVLCFAEEDKPSLQALYERGVRNGVKELKILSGEEARALEPALSDQVVAALYAPTSGIVCPFGMTIAFAENAADNGADFYFLSPVKSVEKEKNGYAVRTPDHTFRVRAVVNAAGLYADRIHAMVSSEPLTVTPRRGEYILMDREVGDTVNATIFQLPGKQGKGVLVTPTVHGNLMVGPSADDIGDKEDTETTYAGMAGIREKARLSVPGVPLNRMITSFSGLRAHGTTGDFVLGQPADAPGFFNVAAIESPGLTAAPAIGEWTAREIAGYTGASENRNFNGSRKGIPHVAEMAPAERAALIASRPDYGRIVCRCENVSEGEIRDAIRRTLGARSLDGVKRRVRQGMGRCQAGFCTPGAIAILAEELGIPEEQVTKNRPGSELLVREDEI